MKIIKKMAMSLRFELDNWSKIGVSYVKSAIAVKSLPSIKKNPRGKNEK